MHSDAAITACREAGKVLLKHFWNSSLNPIDKGKGDIVTIADLEAEKAIIAILNERYPDYSIVSEESGFTDNGSKYCWLIDPLDGTCNYATGIPMFGTSIALLKDKKMEFFVVYNPILDKILYGDKSKLTIDGKETTIRKEPFKEHYVSIIAGYGEFESQTKLIKEISFDVKRVITNWCPTLDYFLLANGTLQTIISTKSESLDLMPVKLIAESQGLSLTDYEGNPIEPELGKPFTGVLTTDPNFLAILK